MEVHLTPELEARLAQTAQRLGRDPGDLPQAVLEQHFEEEGRFVEAVRRGEEALQRAESLTHEEVGRRLERFLRP
jgi:predicted transcriptional regulator